MLGKQALTLGSYNVTVEELFDLFGKFGPIRYVPTQDALQLRAAYETDLEYRQVRQGIANNTKGTAFVVYEDVMDAKQACDKLNGFNFQNRYLVGKQLFPLLLLYHVAHMWKVLYHQPDKMLRSKEDLEARKNDLEQLKKQHGIE